MVRIQCIMYFIDKVNLNSGERLAMASERIQKLGENLRIHPPLDKDVGKN